MKEIKLKFILDIKLTIINKMKIITEKLTEDIINFIIEIESEYNFIGSLQLGIYEDEGFVYINNVVVSSSYRRKGFASKLMTAACEFVEKEFPEIILIKLDDMSDFCRNPNCIYLKMGLKYDEEIGSEMTGKLCDIPRKQY